MESGIYPAVRPRSPFVFTRKRLQWLRAVLVLVFLTGKSTFAFSLLGPYADWMVYTNGYQWPGDIGGPMDISQGYRWNVPVVTYGFDQTFLDFFGTNGVAAVESAIQTINELPPSSQLNITNYPLSARRVNFSAQDKALIDLRFVTLWGLLEQMGLASPTRYAFALRQWNPAFVNAPDLVQWWNWAIPDYVVLRNFDPFTLRAGSYINETLYAAEILNFPDGRHWSQVVPIDALADSYNAISDGLPNFDPYGVFVTGLTRDDVGGLKFLLSPSNFAYESLLPDVHGVGDNASNYVHWAWRVGVDKITFMPQPYDNVTGQFLPRRDAFTDAYLSSNGGMVLQSMERVTTQPDFLFCAYEDGEIHASWTGLLKRTGTTNWINNAGWNSQPGAPGPGIIRPQVRLSFLKMGPVVVTQESGSGITSGQYPSAWGTFDLSTNAPVVYPPPDAPLDRLNTGVRLGLQDQSGKRLATFVWSLQLTNGQAAVLQSSTNLTDWTTCVVVTNVGTLTEWLHIGTSQVRRFFAVKSQ